MSQQATDKRVAVMMANGLEEIEGLTVVDLLYRAGIPCDTVSIERDTLVTSSHGVRVICDRALGDVDFSFEDYDLLVLPGGMPGTTNLRSCEPLCAEVVARAKAGRPLAAICAAPSILAELGILKGRRATSFPGRREALVQGEAEYLEDEVVVDGPLITSRGMGTAIPFGLAIVEHYLGSDAAGRIRESIIYRS